ncbi:aminotransferase class IV [Desulfococcus sp.]|uniref:aminotransferase class IV n=1 Tax=Desulfococcus sp. TaxID=2025834 RepID=UPI003593A09A
MIQEAFCDYYIANHQLLPTSDQERIPPMDLSSIYEVIKIIDGVPIFFEEHMARLKQSLRLSGAATAFSEEAILSDIDRLVRANHCGRINVKIVLTRGAGGPRILVYFIRTEYPDAETYARGVATILFAGERETPNVKTLKDSFRERVRAALATASAYEALLLDDNGDITEGSRSNLFFLKGGRLHTPPGQRVLLGVTRQKVMDICRANGIDVAEECIHRSGLPDLEGAFITGTTVDVLPVAAIGEMVLPSAAAPVIRKIIREFAKEVARYIEKRKMGEG